MPSWHYGKPRADWRDEHGRLRHQNCPDWKTAKYVERREKAKVTEIRAGLPSPTPPRKTFAGLCDYHIANRVPQKRSGEHDESIIRCHLRASRQGLGDERATAAHANATTVTGVRERGRPVLGRHRSGRATVRTAPNPTRSLAGTRPRHRRA
jgi:hypothetical protein